MSAAVELAERGLLPEPVLRWGIRRLLSGRLREQRARFEPDREAAFARWLAHMRASPLAPEAEAANRQHYEVPPRFFELVLGPRLKYSAALWEPGARTLGEAEEAMLAATVERAGLADGQTILELGCGWGSLTLFAAERLPRARILALTNSRTQREHVLDSARRRGLDNVEVVRANVRDFDPGRRFERVVSVEMFEHLRNWEELLRRVHGWLEPGGRLFAHVFAHRSYAYAFEPEGADGEAGDWMARHFFSGGMMPSDDLFERVPSPLAVERRWVVPGTHYARTAEAWLASLEERREEVLAVLGADVTPSEAKRRFQRWRLFFLACAELFGWDAGREWWVAHARLARREDLPA
jgi:cyclopropane-fatty-acyl-phospholipid synthase